MPTYDTNVQKAFRSQATLDNEREHCSADPEQLATIGRAKGHQVRVRRAENEYALYTVSETRPETPGTIIRMALVGRGRLTPDASEVPEEFAAIVDSQVPHPTYPDCEAKDHSEFVERLTDYGTHTGLVAIAPHGGAIEEWTDHQAERVASQLAAKGVSCWRCKGWKDGGGALERWHIKSEDICPASFPLLDSIIDRGFAYAVAFHGFRTQGRILIGGAASGPAGDALKQEIQKAIQSAVGSGIQVDIATAADRFNGDDPNNIVNRLANGNGIQIEQSAAARDDHWEKIADAVARVYDRRI
jgi:phage replication-related protein YjqB (UPF0714/DUF867 family)